MFDLTNINWLQCEEFALSNRVKEACELKRSDSNMTTLNIAKIMNLSRDSMVNYLKKGTILGWCNYNPKEENSKGSRKAGKSNGKQVEIFKEDISLGIFPSCRELARQSEELFGVRLEQSCISETCSGKCKQYKGFTFKYIG